MSELIIAYAAPPEAATHAALGAALASLAAKPDNPLPHLRQALSRRQAQALQADEDGEFSFSMPHERAWARAMGWPEAQAGQLPLAAWEARQRGLSTGSAWAWVSPCHWAVGTQQVVLETPEQLQLSAAESQQLLASVRPLLADVGIQLHFVHAHGWLAEGDLFRQVRTAAMERAAGRDVAIWLPAGEAGRPLRRLQSELQMFLYNDPATEAMTEARRAQGQRSVNSFWFSGTGALPAQPQAVDDAPTQPPASPPELHQDWREAALSNDLQAWARGWLRLDDEIGQGRLPEHAVLTLCGERAYRRWHPAAQTPKATGRWSQRIGQGLQTLFSQRPKTDPLAWSTVTQDL